MEMTRRTFWILDWTGDLDGVCRKVSVVSKDFSYCVFFYYVCGESLPLLE